MPEAAAAGPGSNPRPAEPPALPRRDETLLAFDFGTQRLGVAIGNTLTGTVRPLTIVLVRSQDDAIGRAMDLVDSWRPDRVVVGRPLGGEGAGEPVPTTRRAERFARRLQGRSRLPVALVDERYSSMEARQRMRDAQRDGGSVDLRDGDDAWAAVVILEQFLAEAANLEASRPAARAAPSTGHGSMPPGSMHPDSTESR